MADVIHLLPDSVANQIAAGEVIQRPASAVKELMENAVDAGATHLQVLVKEGGKMAIQVTDNGMGMSVTDARMAFERHATSKIKEANDLFAIRTMGFRGEALASIAAIAQVSLLTRRPADVVGTRIEIAGSEVINQGQDNCPAGTTFVVKNLFFNVPARRKFLKSTAIEFRHIADEFIRVALASPEIEFRLTHNESEIYHLPPANIKQRIVHLFGKSISGNLVNLHTQTNLVTIGGYVGKPELARKKYGDQFFFVNNRYMRHAYLHRAVMNAYDKLLAPDAIPAYFVFLQTDPSHIDVNIHPTKTEIKFEDEQYVFQILKASVREALGKSDVMPSIDFDIEGSFEIPIPRKGVVPQVPSIPVNESFNPFADEDHGEGGHRQGQKNSITGWETLFGQSIKNKGLADKGDISEPALFADDGVKGTDQYLHLKNEYILTQVKSGLLIVDQKRAYERIVYEQIIQALAHNQPVVQQVLFPETIELSAPDYHLVNEISDDLQAAGFDIGNLGNNTIVVNGCPADLHDPDPRGVLDMILEDYRAEAGNAKKRVKEVLCRSMARAAGTLFTKKLSDIEMQALIDQLFACENPNYTPSGRKTMTIITIDQLKNNLT